MELMAAREVAESLGISRQRVHQLSERQHDFPAPIAVLAVGRIWSGSDIREWAARHRPASDDDEHEAG